MDKQTPTKPQKSKRIPPPQVEVEAPQDGVEESNVTSMKRTKIGAPTIGRSTDYVQTVGLGNLTVITANGKRTNT